MQHRKDSLITDQVYHVFTKSIAGYVIFNNEHQYRRMKELLSYYNNVGTNMKFSQYKKSGNDIVLKTTNFADMISYCLMPTHIHLVLRQLVNGGIIKFMSLVLNAYSKYFNLLLKRKGPLWESRFKNVLIETDEQLLHITRYVHLNPTTAMLTQKPEDWKFSSYREYLGVELKERICNFKELVALSPREYKKFVEGQIPYQKELALIRTLMLDT